MLKITKQSDYGVLLMAQLADAGTRLASRELAERSGLPLPMVSKILKQLAAADLLTSTRGAHGGYALARPPQNITVSELLGALEGPLALTECSVPGQCTLESGCSTRPMWRTLDRRLRELLEGISLAEMMQPVPDLSLLEGGPANGERGACLALLADSGTG